MCRQIITTGLTPFELFTKPATASSTKWFPTTLILLGLLAQMTGQEPVSSAASGHHYQVQRVMSMHNNNSLPFTPSSTSSLGQQQQQQLQHSVTSTAAADRMIQWQLSSSPSSSSAGSLPSAVLGGHRKLPNRTTISKSASGGSGGGLLKASPSIRHWWTAVFHHHGDQHSSPLRPKRVVQQQPMCLHEELATTNSVLRGEPEWEDRVCETTTLDDRVRVLLEALPCPQHRVCQILSPEVLRRLARPDECRHVARELWKNVFHKLYLMIHDFSDVFQQKFDIGEYSAMHENQRCKEAYTFWTCSTHLPMWLLDPDTNKSVQVEACRSTCLMVEKRCPFLVKGTEDDMASGNPSFICKDDQVPSVVSDTLMPTPCCYSLMLDPLPGQGFPIKVPNGFCHEPDHVQLHLQKRNQSLSADDPGGRPASGHPGGKAAAVAQQPKVDSTLLPASTSKPFFHHALSCDKLLWPSASLNVTTSRDAWEWQGWSTTTAGGDLNSSSLSAAVTSLEIDSNLIVALARWLGFDDEFTDDNEEQLVAFTKNQGANEEGGVLTWILVLSWIFLQQAAR